MTDAWRERIVYYAFAAGVGLLLLLNFLDIFKTIFGIDTAILIALFAGWNQGVGLIRILFERGRFNNPQPLSASCGV